MVRRAQPPTSGGRSARASQKRPQQRRRRGDDDDDAVQRPGKLMLNNPLIPAEMDEDIDDDLAFDSDDEALYGHFFSHDDASKEVKKGKASKTASKKGRERSADDEFPEEELGAIGRAEKSRGKRGRSGADDEENLYNYHEEGQSSGDDGEEYLDLTDMFDLAMKDNKEKTSSKGKKTKKSARAEVDDAGDAKHIAKKRRSAKVTEESESLFGTAGTGVDGAAHSFSSALRSIVRETGESRDEQTVKQRLRESLANKHNLLSIDADDPTKERVVRKHVRAAVEQSMEKYKPALRELNTSRHVQLPLKMPNSAPTPSSIGGIVAVAQARLAEDSVHAGAGSLPPSNAAGKLATRMNDLLTRAGLSRAQLREEGAAATDSGAQARSGRGATDSLGNYVQLDDGDEDADGEGPSRSYVAKLKAMMAYENSRRKRFNRIKSKTYRRILRKEKDREKERRQKAFELLHPELARKRLTEKLMKSRAEERVTQKHKNTSAWVKHAKRFTEFDANAKDAVDEQHAIHQRLMQKMEQEAGEENYERYLAGDADEVGSAVSSEEERVVDALFASADSKDGKPNGSRVAAADPATSVLWSSVEGEGDEASDGSGGMFTKARAELRGMKFMKAAKEREEKEYAEQMEALKEDIRRYQNGEDVTVPSGAETAEGTSRSQRAGALGRQSFSAAKLSKGSNGTSVVETIQVKKQVGLSATSAHTESASDGDTASEQLSVDSDGEDRDGSQDGGAQATSSKLPSRRSRKESSTKASAADSFAGLRQGMKPRKKNVSSRVTVTVSGSNLSVSASSGKAAATSKEEVNNEEEPSDDLRAHQEYLISRAFAHDDVDEDFVKDKEAQVEAIMRPEDRNENLPGWGEWGGEDPNLNKQHQEKLAHSAFQRKIEKSFLLKSRADAALEHVIINHDGVELVPDRMTLHMVPRPFSNPQEFSRSMRQPLGPEWSSAIGFKEGVRPRLEVQQGQSVLPLDVSLHQRKTKSTTKRRKSDAAK